MTFSTNRKGKLFIAYSSSQVSDTPEASARTGHSSLGIASDLDSVLPRLAARGDERESLISGQDFAPKWLIYRGVVIAVGNLQAIIRRTNSSFPQQSHSIGEQNTNFCNSAATLRPIYRGEVKAMLLC